MVDRKNFERKSVKNKPDIKPLGADFSCDRRQQVKKFRSLLEHFPVGTPPSEELSNIGISRATFFRWKKTYLKTGDIASLFKRPSSGGRGKSRLDPTVDKIIEDELKKFSKRYGENYKASKVWKRVESKCLLKDLEVPCYETVLARSNALSPYDKVEFFAGKRSAQLQYGPLIGRTPKQDDILARIQIDHTLVDAVCVNRRTGLPIGRPWLTVAVDEASRAVMGLSLGFNAPSSSMLADFMAHSIFPKGDLLLSLDIPYEWPMHGLPREIYTDQGKDFTSKAFVEGCDNFGITATTRPGRNPKYGGIIERHIGLQMEEVHLCPGDTSKMWEAQGRTYNPNETATTTIEWLEEYLITWVTGVYHTQQDRLKTRPSPNAAWQDGLSGRDGFLAPPQPRIPPDRDWFRLSLLPYKERTIPRTGIQIEYLRYFDELLIPFLHSNDKRKYKFHYSTNDMSHIWFRDPNTGRFHKLRLLHWDGGVFSLAEWNQAGRQCVLEGKDPKDLYTRLDALRRLEAMLNKAHTKPQRIQLSKAETRRERAQDLRERSKPSSVISTSAVTIHNLSDVPRKRMRKISR